MGATHLNTDAASSAEHPDEDISVQTRYQAPIRHATPATPEVSVPLNVPPVVTGSHPVISATSTVIIQDGMNPPIVVRTHPTGPLPPFPGQGQLPAFLRTYTADEVKERKQKLKKNLLVRAVILSILTLVEGLIISQYTQPLAICFGFVAALYLVVQMWPLMRPPNDSTDASVYSVWAICSLIGYVAVGLVLSPITFLLLMLDWAGVSMGLDPLLILIVLGLVWLSEVGLSLLTIYRFNNLRIAMANRADSRLLPDSISATVDPSTSS